MDLNEKNVEVETKSEEIVEHFIKTKSSLFKKIKNMVSKLSEKEYLKLKMEVLKNGNKASLPMLFDAVVNCKNPKIILDYAKTFGDSEAKLSYAISNTKNAEYIYKYALEVKDANISVLSVGMKDSQNYPYIFRFAKNIDNADIEVLSEGMATTKDAQHIYFFATFIKDANLKVLSEGVARCGNAPAIYYFAKDVKGADLNVLSRGIAETNNAEYIYKFFAYKSATNKQSKNEEQDLQKVM